MYIRSRSEETQCTAQYNAQFLPILYVDFVCVQTPVLFFVIHGPKFIKLRCDAQKRLQFVTPFFPVVNILFHSGDKVNQG